MGEDAAAGRRAARRGPAAAPPLGPVASAARAPDMTRAAEADPRQQQLALAAARAALEAEHQRYQEVFDLAPDGHLVTDAVGTIREANRAAGRLLGREPDSLLGRSALVFMPRPARAAARAALAHLRGEEPAAWLITLRPRGGEPVAVAVTVAITRAPDVLRWLLRDVTTRQRDETRLRFLAEAGTLPAAALDEATAIAGLVRLAVPALADYCIADLLDADGVLREVAVAHADPARAATVRAVRRQLPADPTRPRAAARVVASGQPELLADITDAYLDGLTPDPALRALLRQLRPRSRLTVPLIARGRTLGVLSLQMAESGRRYGPADLALAEEVARRAALALDNARLFAAGQRAEAASRAQAERLRVVAEVAHVAADIRLALPARLARAAEVLVTTIGDGCVIRLLSDDGQWLHSVAAEHRDPAARAALRAALMPAPQRADVGAAGEVLVTGEALLLPEATPDRLRALTTPDHWVYLTTFPIHSLLILPLAARGRVIGTLGVVRDRTPDAYADEDRLLLESVAEHVAQAIDNARLAEAAQAAVRLREEFVSIASHELRTPLTTIKGYGQVLAREAARPTPDRARLSAAADKLQAQVARLETLVVDLLDAARIRHGRLDLRPEPVDLVALAREVLARAAVGDAENHRLALMAPAPVMGRWDAARLDQVVTNLVANAVKYSPAGGEVRVAVRYEGSAAVVAVGDDGVGMTVAEQAALFQPFARGAAGGRGIQGAGLGLYIVAQIVTAHGGAITVESAPGTGSTFTVRLPLAPPAEAHPPAH